MKKHQILKESALATLLILLVSYSISFIPLSLEYGKALHQGFADFDIYDLYYSGKNTPDIIVNNDIVLVELGADRSEIADQVQVISKYAPSVIGIDATFEEERDSSDKKFSEVTSKNTSIVYAAAFDKTKRYIPNVFCIENNPESSGYIDFSSNPKYAVIRTYVPFITINKIQYEAFTSCIARKADIKKYEKLKSRDNKVEIINYVGNLNNFFKITRDELETLDSMQLETLIRNKIVLMGFFVKNPPYPLVMDDLYYSPLNERVSGKSFPDMYGVVVHANILTMVLKGNYATLASKRTAYFFAFLISFFLNLYFITRFHKKTHPPHAKLMLVQFLSILLVLYLFLMIYKWFLYKVALEPIMISMVLSLELLGLYKNIALWLHKKYGYTTVFTHKHIV